MLHAAAVEDSMPIIRNHPFLLPNFRRIGCPAIFQYRRMAFMVTYD
jgi:hypothetical protein